MLPTGRHYSPTVDDSREDSTFAGQFVGDGAAAIGTWSINASGDASAQKFAAAFGVEVGDECPETKRSTAVDRRRDCGS